MALPWILQGLLQNLVQQKVRETVYEAAREQMASQAEAASRPPQPCQVAMVFAMSEEAGRTEDRLTDAVRIAGEGFSLYQGELKGRAVVAAVSGAGRQRAIRATEAVIAVHRARWIISAGFCGALQPELNRHDIVVADTLLDGEGKRLNIDLADLDEALLAKKNVHVGPILEVERIVRTPRDKRALGQTHQALAADLESLAVAEACRRRGVRFLCVRAISDAMNDKLPREVEHLMRQKTRAAQFGAALGAILDRPGSLKKMYALRQNALESSDRLAKFLAKLVERLVPPPAEPHE